MIQIMSFSTRHIHISVRRTEDVKDIKVLRRIHALIGLNNLRQPSGKLSNTRFLGLKSDGKVGDGYPLQSSTLKLFGRT